MIDRLSSRLCGVFVSAKVIGDDERELYTYGIRILAQKIIVIFYAVGLGGLLGVPAESALFILSFMLIRRYGGGYHAKTQMRCNIITFTAIFVGIVVIRIVSLHTFSEMYLAVYAVSAALTAVLSPVDNDNKRLTVREKKVFKSVTWGIILLHSLLLTVFYRACMFGFTSALIASGVLEALLVAAGKGQVIFRDGTKLTGDRKRRIVSGK